MSRAEVEAPERVPVVQLVVVVAIFAVLFGVEIFEAVSNIVALPAYYAAFGIGDATPWPVLIAGLAVPVVAFAVALLLGAGRTLVARAIVLVIALAASNAIALSLVAVVNRLLLDALG